jgi:hypothetical protein
MTSNKTKNWICYSLIAAFLLIVLFFIYQAENAVVAKRKLELAAEENKQVDLHNAIYKRGCAVGFQAALDNVYVDRSGRLHIDSEGAIHDMEQGLIPKRSITPPPCE